MRKVCRNFGLICVCRQTLDCVAALLWMGFQIRVILGVPQKWAYIMQTQMFPFSSWLTLFCFINTIARGDRHEERF